MAFYLSPVLNEQQFDANGDPRAGALISTYLAGTLTATTTYKTSTGTAHTNPIQLDSSGNYPNGTQLWLQGGFSYKFVITDSNGANSRTYDNIIGIGDNLNTVDEWLLYGAAPTYIGATSFSVVGDQTGIFQVARRIKSTNTGGTVYSTITASVFAAGATTVTVLNTSGVLDSGLSAVSYGLLAAVNPSTPAIRSMVRLRTANGVGSTNTAIRRLTTTVLNQGSDIIYADSATLGATFTIVTADMYAISATDSYNNSNYLGFSLNSTQLTTGIASITPVDRLNVNTSTAANQPVNCAWAGYLLAGDIVRMHVSAGVTTGADTGLTTFTIARMS